MTPPTTARNREPQIDCDRWDNGLLVIVGGRLDQRATSALDQCLRSGLQGERPQIVVDMSAVNYINSGGLRSLISAWRQAQRLDGQLLLCGLDDRLLALFAMMGFDQLFLIFPDQESALHYFTTDETATPSNLESGTATARQNSP